MHSYREPLPAGCPPAEAALVKEGKVVYRLARTAPPTEVDFHSWRKLYPKRPRPANRSECEARAVSVHERREGADSLRRLRKFRRWRTCQLRLNAQAGKIKQTGEPGHLSWWPFAGYDVLQSYQALP